MFPHRVVKNPLTTPTTVENTLTTGVITLSSNQAETAVHTATMFPHRVVKNPLTAPTTVENTLTTGVITWSLNQVETAFQTA